MDNPRQENGGKHNSVGGFRYALLLFLLAPFVGEFLLGNLPITWLGALIVLAPLYGGGAILIRETTRRFGWGWPSMITLGLSYAVVEEAFVTQSLFNPNYVGLRLLDFGFIPKLGISSWWTVFVLGIHTIWSTTVPIALVEAVSLGRSRKPWLGKAGLGATAVLFLFGCVASAMVSGDPFRATNMQFVASGTVVIALFVAAVILGLTRWRHAVEAAVPAPWRLGVGSLVLGSAFMAIVHVPVLAISVGGMVALLVIGGVLLYRIGNRSVFSLKHEFAIACGLLMTYAWYGFVQHPSVGAVSPVVDTTGNALFALGALAFSWFVSRRVARWSKDSDGGEPGQ